MTDASTSADTSPRRIAFFLGTAIVIAGYAMALVGSLGFFKIPLLFTFALLVGGICLATLLPKKLDCRLAFTQTSRTYKIVNIGGSILIAGFMVLFADANWKTWYIHPAGFQTIWFTLVAASFHFYDISSQFNHNPQLSDAGVSEFDETQMDNPYAPPMRYEDRTNKAMHPSRGSADS